MEHMMEKPKGVNVAQRLMWGFGISILTFVLFGLFAFYGMHTVSGLTRTIYNHPLVVSNAALQSSIAVTKMHRSMKDVVLFTAQSEINRTIKVISEHEKQVYLYLDVVKEKIIGNEGKMLESEARILFDNWRPIREEVIEMVQRGEKDTAASITIGKGANHVALLEERMLGLTTYAREKASGFMHESEKAHSAMDAALILFLLLGTLTSFIVAFFTIKRITLAEVSLEKSEERFRGLIESTSDWVWESDQNGIYTYASPKVRDLLGYEPEQMIGKTPFDFMPSDEAERVGGLFRDIVESRESFDALENTNLHKDGRSVVLETSGVPVIDKVGNLTGYRGIDRDITERKQAEEEKDRLLSELKDALSKVKTLGGLLPICSYCKKIRDDSGYYQQLESYIRDRTEADFSHGICPECAEEHFPEMDLYGDSSE